MLAVTVGVLLVSCASPLEPRVTGPHAPDAAQPIANLAEISPGVFTGADPATPEAFDALAAMGVRTIVSVDGARPDIEAARVRGLRYVHIPLGYDDVSPEAQAALAHVMREAEGPVYFHCHHGRHRGPIAAGFAAACAEGVGGAVAAGRLADAGYTRKYESLYRDLESFDPGALDPSAIDAATLREVADAGTLAAAMASMDRTWDRVLLCRDAKWAGPAGHPDIEPTHEARILAEHFREMNRLMVAGEPEEFGAWMRRAEAQAWALEATPSAGDASGSVAAFAAIAHPCAAGHRAYRN